MFRKLLALSFVIVALHVVAVLTLGTSPAGSLIGNLLQIASSGLAVAVVFGASQRATGLSRRFWLLVGFGLAVWGIANVGWMYYEIALHREPPTGSMVRVLFGTQVIAWALAVLLNQDKESSTLDLESVLDFIQVTIVFFLIYLGFYYLPSLHQDAHTAYLREVWMQIAERFVLVLLAVVQAKRARSSQIRKLYRGFAVYLLGYTVCTSVADYIQTLRQMPTGTWYDLGWSIPLLGAALWAANWQPTPVTQGPQRLRQRKVGELLLDNATLAVAPLIVLLQVAQLGTEWQAVRFTLLGVSILCYAARLGLTQYRQNKTEDTLQRHNRAMDSAVNGIAIVDAKGQHTYANAAFAQMLGHESAESIVGRPWQEVYAPQDVERVEKEIRESLRKTGKWYGPMNIHRRDGSALPVEMAITSLPDGGVVCVSRDMTAKRDAENARAQAEAKYKMLVEQVAAISYIAELGIHGEWLYVSPQVETMFGFSTEEWLGDSKAWTQHVHPEDHKIVEAAEAASQRGERFQAEYRVVRKDGRVIWVSDTAVVVEGSDAHPLMEGIIVDITERKQLETQLQQARRMEAIGRLAGGIAHDFNNLLTIIKGYTELALNRPKISPELQADVERIEDASERASTLVRQLLAFSRRQVLQPKLLDLNSIVMGLDKLLRRLMDEAIQMSTVPGKNIGTIKADPGQMEQVIMNLVVNARDAMPTGGRLTVETANVELDAAYASDHATVKPGQYVMLAVSDTGTGMSPETVAHIFEPFYTTKESGRGTGLGLSTVYGIVKQSGGYVWVYSEVGRGTTFKIYLPRVDAPAEDLELPRAPETVAGTETILLAEDDPMLRPLTKGLLERLGYTVIDAENAATALEAARHHGGPIQLLVADVVMPGASGRELARQLEKTRPRTKVLYVSGYTDDAIVHHGMLEPGLNFLQKPFTPATLARKVREVLDGT